MRRIEFAPILAAVGGIVLLVSLFLHWYQPALTAWTVFEVWDVVLAVLAVAGIWVAVASVAWEASARDGALPLLGGAAFQERHRLGTEKHHSGRPNEVSIDALSTVETVLTFDRPQTLQYICHMPGHEAYGMVGTLTIN